MSQIQLAYENPNRKPNPKFSLDEWVPNHLKTPELKALIQEKMKEVSESPYEHDFPLIEKSFGTKYRVFRLYLEDMVVTSDGILQNAVPAPIVITPVELTIWERIQRRIKKEARKFNWKKKIFEYVQGYIWHHWTEITAYIHHHPVSFQVIGRVIGFLWRLLIP